MTMEDMDRYPGLRRQKAEHAISVQSVATYVQTILFWFIITGSVHVGSAHLSSVKKL